MEFQLTEEVSQDVLLQFSTHRDLVLLIKKEANRLVTDYYFQYVNNFRPGFFHKNPRWKEKIVPKMTKGEDIIYNTCTNDFCFAGPCFSFDKVFLAKAGIEYTKEELDFLVVAGTTYMYSRLEHSRKLEVIEEFHSMLVKYGNVPYKMNSDEIRLYESVASKNTCIRNALESIGVQHDL